MRRRRRTLVELALIIAILLPFLHPLLTPGLPITHDGEVLVARIAAYAKAFADGHIPPRWAGDLNYGYGAPVFIFFYPFLGYLGSLLHAIGFGYIDSYKLLGAVAFLGSGVGFFLWLRTRVSSRAALVGALVWALSPYQFLNLYVRGDIGELIALAIVPLVLWAIEKSKVILGGIAYATLILSHHGIALFVTPVLVGYALLGRRGIILFPAGLGLSAYFWLPVLVERKFTAANLLFGTFFRDHFLQLSQFISAPWGFGDRVGVAGGLTPQIGLVHTIAAIVAVGVLLKIGKMRRELFFWLGAFFLSLLFLFPISQFIWERFSLLAAMGFPWRFTSIASLSVATIIGLAAGTLRKQYVLFIALPFLFAAGLPMVNIAGSVSKPDAYWETYPGTTSYHGETTTIWTAGDPGVYTTHPVEIIEGKGTIGKKERKTQKHTFAVDAETGVKLVDNTIYFPGWQVFVNGKKTPIEFQDPNHRGLITFSVPAGVSTIEVKFTESPIRLVADMISIATVIAMALLWIVA